MPDYRYLTGPRYKHSHALVIGVDTYQHCGPLAHARSDAHGVAKALVAHCGFASSNVATLFDKDANRQSIVKALHRYLRDDVTIDDRIVIYFAGHGHTVSSNRGDVGYLVPSDGDPTDLSSLVCWREFSQLGDMIRAKHIFYIVDACYSGLALKRGAPAGTSRFVKDMLRRYSRQVIAAGKADEQVSDADGPLAGHSIFTGHLIRGLAGHARQNDVLTANQLMSYVYKMVAGDVASRQTPHYGTMDGDGDLVLCAKVVAVSGSRAPAKKRDASADGHTTEATPEAIGEHAANADSQHTAGTRDVPTEDSQAEPESDGTEDQIVVLTGNDMVEALERTDIATRAKVLLSTDSGAIELHDIVVKALRDYTQRASGAEFDVNVRFTKQVLITRIAGYESAIRDVALAAACVAHWHRSPVDGVLGKIFGRLHDQISTTSGLTVWLNLRWHPVLYAFYCAGMGAVEGRRYDVLAALFGTRVSVSSTGQRPLVLTMGEAVLGAVRDSAWKMIPGFENHFFPHSEHLFSVLQPEMDGLFLLGTSYERQFDEFEILFALAVIDYEKNGGRGGGVWAPPGRYAWKWRRYSDAGPPLDSREYVGQLLAAGLFGGSWDRFGAAVAALRQFASELRG